MGFFDDPNTMALLSAAGNLFQAGAPSSQRIGLGQALGSGLQGYAGSLGAQRKQQQDALEAQQMAKLRDLQILEATGSLEQKQAARVMAQNIKADLAKMQMGQQAGQVSQQAAPPPSTSAGPLLPGASPLSSGADSPDWLQQYQQQRGAAPQIPAPASTAGSMAPQPGQNMTQQYANRLLQEAEVYSRNGDFAGADQRYQAAAKLIPEVSKIEVAQRNGQPVRVITMKDGTERVSEFDAPADMQGISLGNKYQFVDKNRLQNGQSFAMNMTPGESATNSLGRDRLSFERQQAMRPQYNNDQGGFITPPSAANPGGLLTPLAGAAPKGSKMTEDQSKATGWLVQAENAFGNMKTAIQSTPSASRPGFNDALAAVPSFGLGEAVGNKLRGDDRQKFIQGASSLSEALLRAATGAGVNKEEAQQKIRELTPVTGDSDAVIEQKMASIPLYIESLKVRSGPGAAQAAQILKPRAPAAAGGWSIQKVGE